jgi:cardiolipin synthase
MHHIPNLLTVLRLILSLAMFAALVVIGAGLSGAGVGPQAGLWLARFAFAAFIVAGVTDFFDGWLARRWGAVSLIGAILDPIADKILVCSAILGLLAVHAPGVMIPGAVILFREFSVSAMREVLAPMGIKLPVTFLAKAKTTLQLVALAAIMFIWFWPAWKLDARIDHLQKALYGAEILMGLAAVVTLWTGLEYARSALKALLDRRAAAQAAAAAQADVADVVA